MNEPENEPTGSTVSAPDPIAPIYLSYTDADGVAPFFQVLDGAAGFELVKAGAGIMKRVATVLHTSGKEGDAPLEIVCVTDAAISQAQAEAISQRAINFAMETGLVPMRRDEPRDRPMDKPEGGGGYGFSPN